MHNPADFHKLIKAVDKDFLRWRAYAQLGAMMVILVLLLIIAIKEAIVDTSEAAQARVAVPPVLARAGSERSPPEHAKPAPDQPADAGAKLPAAHR